MKSRWRQRLGVEDETIFLYAGDLEMGGGASRVVEAATGLSRDDVIVVMACRRKTEAAAAEERALRARIDALGLARRFRWVGETSEILDLVGASDVLLLPSVDLYAKMDYPLVVLEAMAMGVPGLVAEATPASEIAALGGVVAIPEGSSALEREMKRLVVDRARREAIGAAGREVARARFSPQAMADAYESLYDELAS